MNRIYYSSLFFLLILGSCFLGNEATKGIKSSKEQVAQMITKVNNYWQENHSPEQKAFWHQSVYQTGNMAAYFVTGNEDYRDYARKWAEYNHWMGATSQNKEEWKYSYGRTDDHVLFGDWQACFQVYIDLYNLDKEDY